MAYPHEHTGSTIAITTRLSGPRLAEISEYVAETSGPNGSSVCFEGFEGSYPKFSVRGTGNPETDLRFHVAIASIGRGSTGHTEIDSGPAMPASVADCYAAYFRFIERFGDIVRLEDPAAQVLVN